jgi:hypothetical protein
MALFGSASSAQVDEFAKGLARELVTYLPPVPGPRGPTPKKIFIACERTFAKALAFKQEHKLGIYKKARLGNTLRWELETLGYNRPFAEEVSRRLVIYIAGKR